MQGVNSNVEFIGILFNLISKQTLTMSVEYLRILQDEITLKTLD